MRRYILIVMLIILVFLMQNAPTYGQSPTRTPNVAATETRQARDALATQRVENALATRTQAAINRIGTADARAAARTATQQFFADATAFYAQFEAIHPQDLAASVGSFIGRNVVIQGTVDAIVDDYTFVIKTSQAVAYIYVTTDNLPRTVRRGETVTAYGVVEGPWLLFPDPRIVRAQVAKGKPRLTLQPAQLTPPVPVECPSLRYICPQLSCPQAYACFRQGNRRLDDDNDSVPCEIVCPHF